MPGGTRRIARTVRASPITPPVISSFANEPCGQRYAPLGAAVPTLPALEQPAAPKHFPFPSTPVDDDLFFEFLMCFFTVTSAGLQYLHLYRSVWWLPHSYTNHALVSSSIKLWKCTNMSLLELLFNRQIPSYVHFRRVISKTDLHAWLQVVRQVFI